MARVAKKKEEAVSLETVLWNCRVALRGVGSTDKNRDAVIGLCFLKFAGDKFEKRRAELKTQYGDIPAFLEKASFYNAVNVFYLKETARWDYIVKNAGANDIAVILDQAMADIEESNPSLKGALSLNLYATLGAPKEKIKQLIDEVNKIDESRFHEEDLIGRVYEYFLQVYAASGTKEDGEFYTPACVVQLIAEMIEPYSGVVYDPCCGSGGMFVQSHKFVESHHGNRKNISVIGQESVQETWRLCKMNLAIRGISHNLGEKNASTFTEDLHKDKKVDFIMANPPFNLKGWRGEDQLLDDPRWQGYGVPRVSNANYAWILHMISKLDVNHGIAGFLLANGALNDPDEYEIRKQLLLNDKIEAIIVLPRDMFYTTDISVTLWIVNMNKKASTVNGRQVRDRRGEVLFMDLRRWDQNVEEIVIDKGKKKKKTVLTPAQIADVKKVYDAWQSVDTILYADVPEFCQSVKILKKDKGRPEDISIEDKDFSLAPSKYIEFIDHDLDIDYAKEMARIQDEMRLLMVSEELSQSMLKDAFRGIGYGID
ncbi:class I SAM-dependent DNA methyltransferase [Christensenellaceae bacterium 44-20]